MDKYLLEDGTGYYEIEGGTDDYLIDRYVVLNSPADAAAITDTTPTLEFTGTDPEAHDIRYNVRLGTAGFLLKHVDAYLYKAGSPTDHLWIEVRESIGGDIIATSPFVAASSLVASPGSAIRFTLDSAVGLFAGTKYYIVMQRTNLRDTTNAAVWKRQDTDTFAGGDAYSMANGTWGAAQTTADYRFILYDAALTAIISQDLDGGFGQGVYGSRGTNEMQGQSFTVAGTVSVQDKISGTDAGFLNTVNGADTDPFTSGQMASYTVQSALADGTYYWRTRGIDPAGGNVYSDWSETRSFVLTAGGGTTVTPTTGTLSLAAFSPTITTSNHQSVTPSTLAVTTATFAPTVNLAVIPNTLTLSIGTFAPTVTSGNAQSVTPTTASLTIASFAPQVNLSVIPATTSVATTTFAPTVTVSSTQQVIPITLALNLGTFAPSVTTPNPILLTPNTVSLATQTFAPNVSVGEAVEGVLRSRMLMGVG